VHDIAGRVRAAGDHRAARGVDVALDATFRVGKLSDVGRSGSAPRRWLSSSYQDLADFNLGRTAPALVPFTT